MAVYRSPPPQSSKEDNKNMAFKTCIKQLLRNPIKTLLYFLLLALSCLLLCVSVGMLVSALASAAEVDMVFTTIAVPNVSKASDVSAEKVIELAKKSPYVRQVELRTCYTSTLP